MSEASVETTDPVVADAVHVTIPLIAPRAEVKGSTVSTSDEFQGELSVVDLQRILEEVERNTEISLLDLQRILAEL